MHTPSAPDPRLDQIIDCLYRVASKAIIIQDKHLLIVKEPEGWYGLPGGGIDHGQDALQSLVRELREEIGVELDPTSIHPDPVCAYVGGSIKALPRVTLYYRVDAPSDFSPQSQEPTYQWVDRSELGSVQLGPNIELARDKLTALL